MYLMQHYMMPMDSTLTPHEMHYLSLNLRNMKKNFLRVLDAKANMIFSIFLSKEQNHFGIISIG